jgi:hypothetical protein
MNEKKWVTKNSIDKINNIFLDPISEINIIGVENHPKLYDLTIPSTLNFGIANGLQVRDTSTTGYIQRRLIKGLEDLRVEYDMTVRNNMGKIVQFSYGDDGFDSTKVENQILPLVGMSIEDIYSHYDILGVNDQENSLLEVYTKGTQTRVRKQRTETKTKCQKYIDKMIDTQTKIVNNVFKYKNENSVKVPVAFQNLIANIQGQMSLNSNSIIDITPMEAFDLIEQYFGHANKYLTFCGYDRSSYDYYLTNGYDLSNISDEVYDMIVSSNTLQFICIYDIRFNYFKEFFRVLKSGGLISLQMGYGVPSPNTVSYSNNTWNKGDPLYSVAVENVSEIQNDLENIGFINFTYQIVNPPLGDSNPSWIFFRAEKP